MTLEYRIELMPDDNNTLLVSCPQLPMVVTFGETEADARGHALDAIEAALGSMIEDGDDIQGQMERAKLLSASHSSYL